MDSFKNNTVTVFINQHMDNTKILVVTKIELYFIIIDNTFTCKRFPEYVLDESNIYYKKTVSPKLTHFKGNGSQFCPR